MVNSLYDLTLLTVVTKVFAGVGIICSTILALDKDVTLGVKTTLNNFIWQYIWLFSGMSAWN